MFCTASWSKYYSTELFTILRINTNAFLPTRIINYYVDGLVAVLYPEVDIGLFFCSWRPPPTSLSCFHFSSLSLPRITTPR